MDDRLHDLAWLDADVESDADVVLELRLRPAERGQRRDGRDLSRAVVESGPTVDVAVPELDDVAGEVGGDVTRLLRSRARPARRPAREAAPTLVRSDRRSRCRRAYTAVRPGSYYRGRGRSRRRSSRSIREAEELLEIEEADAWFEYLESTRNQSVTRYGEVEPWAWARLNQRLRALGARRAKLKPATAA